MEPNEIRGRYLYNTFLDDYNCIFNDSSGQILEKLRETWDRRKRKGFRAIDEEWEVSIDE